MASALVAMAARASTDSWPEASGAAAQAESVRRRVLPLATENASAYAEALAAMTSPPGTTSEHRDAAIADALTRAAAIPLEIAEAAADTAVLAATVAELGEQSRRGDVAAAAVLASGAARAAANLVSINLAVDDDRVSLARGHAEAAADAVRWTLDLEG